MSYAGVECDPGWIEWAERETIARLKDQLSDRRAKRELRRVSQMGTEETGPAASKTLEEIGRPLQTVSPAVSSSEETPPSLPDHPLHTHVSAFSEPPDRHGATWHDWAEAQTVLRLQQPRKRRRKPAPQPEPVSDLRIEVDLEAPPARTVRVHHENLKAVGI